MSTLDFKTVLCLGLGWLEWACKDANFSVSVELLHLRVREFFVENDAVDELGIFESATGLSNDFDEIKVDITTLKICDIEDSFDSQICIMILAHADDLGAESSSSA